MKLRLHGNEIRVRLNRNEVAEFAKAGRLEDAIDYGDGAILTYNLETSPNANAPKASLRGGVVRVELPANDAQRGCARTASAFRANRRRGCINVFPSSWRRIFSVSTFRTNRTRTREGHCVIEGGSPGVHSGLYGLRAEHARVLAARVVGAYAKRKIAFGGPGGETQPRVHAWIPSALADARSPRRGEHRGVVIPYIRIDRRHLE